MVTKIIYPANTTFPSARANTIQILHTAHQLSAVGNEVHLIARQGDGSIPEILNYYGIDQKPNLKIHLVPTPRSLPGSKIHESMILKETIQLLLRFRGESKVVFSRDPLFISLLLKMRNLLNFRIVYEAHTLFFVTAKETYMPVAWNKRKEIRIRKREKFVFQNSDGIVYISSSLKEFAAEYFSTKRPFAVIHDGAAVPALMPVKKENKLLCYSGQFYGWKGISILLHAMRWVEGATLRLYGGGYTTVKDDLRQMQSIIDQYHLSEKLELCGFIPPSKIAEAISECCIGVLPLPDNIIGNRCNSPLKLFDYLANGLAVVASDLPTVREILNHGSNGHLVSPGNPEKLAEGINKLLKDNGYRDSIAKKGFETARAYSWQKRGEQLSQFLNSIAGRMNQQ
jgi:glycosyltransferase involved in cell wall biosynthesis